MATVPQAVADYVDLIRGYLGYNAYSVNVRAVDTLAPAPADDPNDVAGGEWIPTDARIEVKYDYLHADILIAEDLVEKYADDASIDELDVEFRVLLCHELIHLLDAPIEHVYEQAINLYVKKPNDRRRAFYLVRSHIEHRVTRFAHQLFRMVEARRMLGYSDEEIDKYASGEELRPAEVESARHHA